MKKVIIPWYNRIRVRVLIFGIAMSIIPLLLLGFVSFNSVRLKMEDNIQAQNLERAVVIATQMDKFIESLAENFTSVSVVNGSVLIGQDELERERVMNTLLSQNSYIRGIRALDSKFQVLTQVERMEVLLEEDPWNNRRNGENISDWQTNNLKLDRQDLLYEVSPVYFSSDRRPQFVMTVGIYDSSSRAILGYLQTTVDLKGIIYEFVSQPIGKDGMIYIIDREGNLIGHTDFTRVLRHDDMSEVRAVQQFLANSSRQKTSTEQTNSKGSQLKDWEYLNSDGVKVIGAYARAQQLGWGIFIEQPIREAYQPIFLFVRHLMMILLLIMGAVGALSIAFGLKLTRPIVNLEGAVRHIILTEDLTSHIPRETHDEVGQLVRSFNLLMNLLDEKNRELMREKELLDTVVNGIGAGMVLLNSEKRILWWNNVFAQWFGEQLEKLSGQSIVSGEGIECLILEKENVISLDVEGERRYFRRTEYELSSELGEKERAASLMLLDDVTQQVEMEARVVETDKMAALGLLSAGIAHEINNPLAIVYLHSEELLERLCEEPDGTSLEEIEASLRTISRQIIRCKQITSDLLHFARKKDQNNTLFDVSVVTQQAISFLEYRAKKSEIVIESLLQPHLMTWGNENEWHQVVLNIITNAFDASIAGSKIKVSAYIESTLPEEIQFLVQDFGQGISAKDLKKVLDPFFTTKPTGQGTGLGLFVSYGIVQKMQGSLGIESAEGEGTTVVIRLPLKKQTA